jgi:hypothetical protein
MPFILVLLDNNNKQYLKNQQDVLLINQTILTHFVQFLTIHISFHFKLIRWFHRLDCTLQTSRIETTKTTYEM